MDYPDAPPIAHAVIYRQGSPSGALRGPQPFPDHCPPLWTPFPASAGTHPALPGGLAMSSPPFWADGNLFTLSAVEHTHLQHLGLGEPARASPGQGPPASPSWQPALFRSLFCSSGAHMGLDTKSKDSLCSKQESGRCGSFSALGHRAASLYFSELLWF